MKHSKKEIKEREEKVIAYLRSHPNADIDEIANVFRFLLLPFAVILIV